MNTELIKEVLESILAHPERHDQDTWVLDQHGSKYSTMTNEDLNDCKTTLCVAGWVCALTDVGCRDALVFLKDGLTMDIQIYAQEQLGLTLDQSDYLFLDCDNYEALITLKEWADG